MPQSYTDAQRETRTIHADWWCPDQDANGVYKERVTVRYPQIERDSQWITDAVQQESRREQKGKPITGTGREIVLSSTLQGTKNQRMFTLMRMVVEMTNKDGVNVLPPVNASAQQKMDFWRGVPDADMAYIAEQIDTMNEHDVPVLPSDEDEAERAAERGASDPTKTDPQAVAEARFRAVGDERAAG